MNKVGHNSSEYFWTIAETEPKQENEMYKTSMELLFESVVKPACDAFVSTFNAIRIVKSKCDLYSLFNNYNPRNVIERYPCFGSDFYVTGNSQIIEKVLEYQKSEEGGIFHIAKENPYVREITFVTDCEPLKDYLIFCDKQNARELRPPC